MKAYDTNKLEYEKIRKEFKRKKDKEAQDKIDQLNKHSHRD